MTITLDLLVDEVKKVTSFSGRYICKDGEGKSISVYASATDATFESMREGQTYRVQGRWGTFKPNGTFPIKQFEARNWDLAPTSGTLIKPLLERIDSIGPATANLLWDKFGTDLVDKLSDPECLEEITRAIGKGHINPIASDRANKLVKAFTQNQLDEKSLLAEARFLQELENKYSIKDKRLARKVWNLLGGENTFELLLKNPYITAGILEWRFADALGRKILGASGLKDNEIRVHRERLCGAVTDALRQVLSEGDSCVRPDELKLMVAMRLNRTEKQIKVDAQLAIDAAIKKRILSFDGNFFDGVYRPQGAKFIEEAVEAFLARLEATPNGVTPPSDLGHAVDASQRRTGVSLTPDQEVCVTEILKRRLSVLQGGAGVGKTTVMGVVVDSWETMGGNVITTALSGKACLQLTNAINRKRTDRPPAITMARLLMALEKAIEDSPDLGDMLVNGMREDDWFDLKMGLKMTSKTLVIIDEASMIDTLSLKQLLNFLPHQVNLLLVGDDGQLPPVGWGCVFHDLVQANDHRLNMLTQVLRQDEGSEIPKVAAQIRRGEAPVLTPWEGEAFGVFVGGNIDDVRKCFKEDDIMTISARVSTVRDFNHGIEAQRTIINKEDHRRISSICDLHVGTPVVCTKNRYQEGLMNGLLGKVKGFNKDLIEIQWDGYEHPQTLKPEAYGDVESAYMITCHKSQGSSARVVVVYLDETQLLTRQWLYTAITRARELVLLVPVMGKSANALIEKAVSRDVKRLTGFRSPPDASSTSEREGEPPLAA